MGTIRIASEQFETGTEVLLIVGGTGYGVIELNQQAFAMLNCEKELTLIPGAAHLFEEPGTLQQAAHSAAGWFAQHL